MTVDFAALVASKLAAERFTLLDLGCSGGIDPVWRIFGERLRALGIDASVSECRRLVAQESHPDVHYRGAFVRMLPEHPAYARFHDKPFVTRHPFQRFSARRSAQILSEHIKSGAPELKMQFNEWSQTELADESRPISATEAVAALGWADVDVVKIDVDNPDLEVLTSLDASLADWQVLAAKLEVNFFGGPDDYEGSFHNTDRFMRQAGFELVDLDLRRYSMSALPARYAITFPAQTVTGRLFQADALYVRDVVAPHMASFAKSLSTGKLMKLAAIFALWNQPDSAAEIVLSFRERFASFIDIDAALDMLAAQIQQDQPSSLGYKEYLREFEANAASFYPPPSDPPWEPPTLPQKLRAAWKILIG